MKYLKISPNQFNDQILFSIKKYHLTLLFIFLLNLYVNAQSNKTTYLGDNLTYSRVLLESSNGKELFKTLAENDLYIDHVARAADGFVAVFNNNEIEQLKSAGISFRILVEDLEKDHAERIAKEMEKPEIQKRLKSKKAGFELGSHAGYNTPAELYRKLSEISDTYPNIAAERVSIGKTYEGRDIFMLKISDNPNTDESATEPAVYYDAMHHAREPLSMMTTLYYMFWLVENYGTDPAATHIINNRELFFVPLVNVDGYVYNITTNPDGGGFWRKNRSPNAGSDCIGTDPNRNYGADWGGPGASTSPCSDTYRGSGPFSEPCTQAVRDLVNNINPVMAFSCHSYSEIYIESDWDSENAEKFYADYSLDICAEEDFAYEQGADLLYTVSGATTEFLNSKGTISWTPEIGSRFWEPISEIIPYCEKHLPAFIYIAQVAGDYPDIKQAVINNGNAVLPGSTCDINVELFNKGRTMPANNISVAISSTSDNVSIVNGSTELTSLLARQVNWTDKSNPLQISISTNASAGDIIEVELSVTADGIEYEKETQRWVVGNQNVLLEEDGSNGLGAFISINNDITQWDTTYVMRRSGNECISDSPLQAADPFTYTRLETSDSINLANTNYPVLEFWIAWGLSNENLSWFDPLIDICMLQLSIDGGDWQTIQADDTEYVDIDYFAGVSDYGFASNNPWAKQIVDLRPYRDSTIKFRFLLNGSIDSDPDGVFIDDLRVVDYIPGTSTSTCNDGIQNGNETGIDCGGDCPECPIEITCFNEPGLMQTANTFVCNGASVYVREAFSKVDENSIKAYLMHKEEEFDGMNYITISDNGRFASPGEAYNNQALYISAIIGPPGENGLPIFENECTVWTPYGAEHTFFDPVTINLVDERCEDGEQYIDINLSGGVGTTSPNSAYKLVSDGTTVYKKISVDEVVTFGPYSGSGEYNIVASGAKGCKGELSGNYRCSGQYRNATISQKNFEVYNISYQNTDLVIEEVRVFDTNGQRTTANIQSNYNNCDIELGAQPNGLYFVQLLVYDKNSEESFTASERLFKN